MESWIHEVLRSEGSGLTVLAAVFFLGIIGVVTCGCNYAIFAMVAGFSGSSESSGKTKQVIGSGIAFLAGAVIAMAVIGAIFGYAGGMISASFGNYWKVAAGLVCVIFGLYTMDLLPFRLPSFSPGTIKPGSGLLSAILFGLAAGGLATAFNTCCNPVFPIILAASFVKGSMVWGMLLLTVFATGYALPLAVGLIGIRFGMGKLSGTVQRLGKIIQYTGGILLLIMGFYFLITI
jgi:cytochrome c-type biogenesis protein